MAPIETGCLSAPILADRVGEFGNDVNLENIRPEHALLFEAMRHGLHRAIDYNYFEAFAGKPIPPVAGG